MALEINLKQKGLFKKELTLNDITAGFYRYGVTDEYYRLDEGSTDGQNIIFYNPQHIGRGVEIDWKEGIKEEINLRLPLPATDYDIEMTYDIVRRIADKWHLKDFAQDGEPHTLDDIEGDIAYQKEFSLKRLADFGDKGDRYSQLTIFAVMWPVEMTASQLSRFGHSGSGQGFATFLHNCQCRDLFYAVPRLYRMNDSDSIVAIWTITATVDSIIPDRRRLPVSMAMPGEKLPECEKYLVSLVSIQQNKMLTCIDYNDFLQAVGAESLERMDYSTLILPGLSEEKVANIAATYPNRL